MSTFVSPSNIPRNVRAHSLSSANATGAVARAELVRRVTGQPDELVGRIATLRAEVAQGEAEQRPAAPFDRPPEHGVLDRRQLPAQHAGDELGGEALAGEQAAVAVASAGVHRVDAVACHPGTA